MAACRRSKVHKMGDLVYDHVCRDHLEEIREAGFVAANQKLASQNYPRTFGLGQLIRRTMV